VIYLMTYSSGFADTLTRLGPPAAGQQPSPNAADQVDQVLAGQGPQGSPTTFPKSGYLFTFSPIGAYPLVSAYSIHADPVAQGSSGQRGFFTNQPLVIRANATGVATASDNPL
jgi:type IV pilus assembly protein PilA